MATLPFLALVPDCSASNLATVCISRATEALPKVQDLRVQKSGVRPMPPLHLANWKGHSKPVVVDLEAVSIGVLERYSYLCASDASGKAFVQRIME